MAELYGTYRGVVTDTGDPMGRRRLKVDVPIVGLAGGWAEASLPPVPPSLLVLPEQGATVWVQFEGGDASLPIWTGAASTEPPA